MTANSINITRGDGDPLNILLDLERDEQIIEMIIYKPEQKLLLASCNGKGFIVNSDDVLAQTKLGKKVMNVANSDKAMFCKIITAENDSVAIIGSNRKLLIFKIAEISEMKRGQGVQLQKYQDAKLSALKLFTETDGLTWTYLGKERREKRLTPWIGKRGRPGKIPPAGLAKNNKFD